MIDRYIPCKCIKDNTGNYIPLWKCECTLSKDNYTGLSELVDVKVGDGATATSTYDLFYDLVDKKVIIGSIIVVKDTKEHDYLIPGARIIRDKEDCYKVKVIDEIEEIIYDESEFESYIIKANSPDIRSWMKDIPELNLEEIKKNKLDIVEVRRLTPFFKTKKGFVSKYPHSFDLYEE